MRSCAWLGFMNANEGGGCPVAGGGGDGALPAGHPALSSKTLSERLAEPLVFQPFEPLHWARDEDNKQLWQRLLSIQHWGATQLGRGDSRWYVLNAMLDMLLREVDAEYGFFARLISSGKDAAGVAKAPVLKILSYTNIAWTPELQELVEKLKELEFPTVGGGTFAHPLRTGSYVIVNDPSSHPYWKGLPAGHPPLHNVLALPIMVGGECIGVVGLANHPSGRWTDALAQLLMPFCGILGGTMLLCEANPEWLYNRANPDAASLDFESASTTSGPYANGRASEHREERRRERERERRSSTASAPHSVMEEAGDSPSREPDEAEEDEAATVSQRSPPAPPRSPPLSSRTPVDDTAAGPAGAGAAAPHRRPTEKEPGDDDMSVTESLGAESKARSWGGYQSIVSETSSLLSQQARILESVTDGIMVFDEDLRVQTVNAAGVQMLRFRSFQDLVKTFPEVDQIISSSMVSSAASAERKAFSTCRRGDESKVDLKKVLSFSDTISHVRLAVRLVLNPVLAKRPQRRSEQARQPEQGNAAVLSTAAVVEEYVEADLSISAFMHEGAKLYIALFRDLSQDKSYQQKDTMIAFMAHEIRNPVQAIISGAEVLADEFPDSELVADVRTAADLLLAVVNQTIDYVQIASRRFEAKWEPVDLVQLVNACYRVYARQAPPDVERAPPHFAPGAPQRVIADRYRISQMLGNLLSNASKFTTSGSIRTFVRLDHEATPASLPAGCSGMLVIEVEDTGSGIPTEEQAKLFRFFTRIAAHASNKQLSSGLGLLLSRDIARALGGDMRLVHSRPGKGSIFEIRAPFKAAEEARSPTPLPPPLPPLAQLKYPSSLPLQRSRAGSAGPVQAAPPPLTATGEHQKQEQVLQAERERVALEGLKVLVCDDNLVVRTCVDRLLKGRVAVVDLAENGQQCLDRIVARGIDRPYDLVMMDCHMPVMDGFEAVSELRRRGYSGKVLAMTGAGLEEDIKQALSAGYDDLLLKPIRNAAILASVLKWTSISRAM